MEELRHAGVPPVQEPQSGASEGSFPASEGSGSGEGSGRVRRLLTKPGLQNKSLDFPREGQVSGYGGLESTLRVLTTLEVTQGQIVSQSPTDATSSR